MNNESASYTASEVRSGFFVALSASILLGLLFMTSGSNFFEKYYSVDATFHYISGLKKNAPVLVGGHEVGKVTGIQFKNTGTDSLIHVTLSLKEGTQLFSDALVFIEVLGFMGEKYIEITPGTPGGPILQPGAILKGEDPVPLMEVVKRGTELLGEFEKIADSLEVLIKDAGGLLNRPQIDSIFNNLDTMTVNLKDMTHDLKRHPWKLLRKGKEKKDEEEEKKD